MNFNALPPVIIIGMHRSGTSILARILEELGLFVGYKKNEKNNEALFFYKLNEWMLDQANATWDNPHNFNFINDFFKKEIVRVLNFHLKGFRRFEYLGFKNFLKYKDVRNLDFPWGWKDPVNTFTVNIWKEIFPKAKVLHIYRNPVDVAESLRNREILVKKNFHRNFKKVVKEILLLGKVYYQYSLRIQNLLEGIKLWQEYVEKALSLDADFKENILHLRYETFLESPEEILKNILTFLGLKVKESDIFKVAKNISSDRKFAFTREKELIEVYNQIRDKDIMKKLGYYNII